MGNAKKSKQPAWVTCQQDLRKTFCGEQLA